MKSEETLTERHQVRFTQSEMDSFRAIAEHTNRSVSSVIRWAAIGFLMITDSSIRNVLNTAEIDPDAKLIDLLKPAHEIDPTVEDINEPDNE